MICGHCRNSAVRYGQSVSHEFWRCPVGHLTSVPRTPKVPHDPPDFDLPAERIAGEVGAERADEREGDTVERWKALADEALDRACRDNDLVISDHVWQIVDREWDGPMPVDGRAMSGVMMRGRMRGVCEVTELYQKSARKGCHGHPRSVWRSLVRRESDL